MKTLNYFLSFYLILLNINLFSFSTLELDEYCKSLEKKLGSFTLIIMAPQTGKLIFSFNKENINAKYSIGSLIKPFTYLASTKKNKIDPDKIHLCKGSLPQTQEKICWLSSGHGNQNLVSALANSCNSFFYHEITKPYLTQTDFIQTLNHFQFDYFLKEDGLLDENFHKLAIGLEGYLIATPYSVLNAYNAMFNGGLFFNEKNEIIKTLSLSQDEIDIIKQGMRGAYLFGSAKIVYQSVKIPDIAAKTGTGTAGKGGFITKKTSGWIILFYPSEKPDISLLILTESGRGGKEASEIASALLKKIIPQ